MSRIDKMSVFLKELTQTKNKLIFTTDELTSELVVYFKLKNRNTAAKYIELLDADLRYIEYLANQKWKVVFCNTEKPRTEFKPKPITSIDEIKEQNKSFFLELQKSISNIEQTKFEDDITDYMLLLKKYYNNVVKITRRSWTICLIIKKLILKG